MLQIQNIFQSIQTLFLANTDLAVAIPGGLTNGTIKAGTPKPYAKIEILPGESNFTTGAIYDQDYEITITTWFPQTIAQASVIGLQFYQMLNVYTKFSQLSNGAITLHIKPLPMKIDPNPTRDIDPVSGLNAEFFEVKCCFIATLNEYRNA